jgi:hypothetical protein
MQLYLLLFITKDHSKNTSKYEKIVYKQIQKFDIICVDT